MATLSLQNFTSLVQNEAASMQGASTVPLNFDPGSVLLALVQADAAQGLWLQYLVLLVLQVTRLATSNGGDVDSFGADFGFTRLPAVAATGSVTFSRFTATQAAFIPVGAQVMTGDGTQSFTVTEDQTNSAYIAGPPSGYNLPAGQVSITLPIEAVNTGIQGNVLAGTITLIIGGIAYVDTVVNALALTNGVNAESDAAFRSRFVDYINSRTEATELAVGYAVESLQQGLSYTIQENQTANGTYTPGTFVVTVDDGTGDPPETLIEAATTAIQAIRPIGSTAIVQPPQKVLANVTLTISVLATATKTLIIPEVADALTAYIEALPVGATMPFNRIAQVAFDADPNITNISSVTLNGGTADLTATPGQVIRAGNIVVN